MFPRDRKEGAARMNESESKTQPRILPWTRSCFVCGQDNPNGLKLKSRVDGGQVVLDYTPRVTDLGWRHLVHGGIAMTLLDEVMTWAAILAARRACVAAEMTVRLKKPIAVGDPLRIEGWVIAGKTRMLLTEGRILNRQGEELVTASGKYLPMPADQVSLCRDDFVSAPGTLDPRDILGLA